jgi:hypothetical protein
MLRILRCACVIAVGLLAARLDATPLPGSVPYSSVARYAASHKIALQDISTRSSEPARTDDEVIYLLTLQIGTSAEQWLVRLGAAALDPRKGDRMALPTDTIFTSTGLELRYAHTPAAVAIEFIGPFEEGTPPDATIPTHRGRTVVSAESLQLGLARYCESGLAIAARLKTAGIANPSYNGFGNRPDAKTIEAGRQAAAAFQLAPEEERLAFSVFFALRAFYTAASEIPACREVLAQVVQKPSVWSIARNFGINTNFEYGWHQVSRMPDDAWPVSSPVYALPVKLALSGTPALKLSLAVTDTRPPLRHCAGIVGIVAEHPTDPTRRVLIHLLSARRGSRE